MSLMTYTRREKSQIWVWGLNVDNSRRMKLVCVGLMMRDQWINVFCGKHRFIEITETPCKLCRIKVKKLFRGDEKFCPNLKFQNKPDSLFSLEKNKWTWYYYFLKYFSKHIYVATLMFYSNKRSSMWYIDAT